MESQMIKEHHSGVLIRDIYDVRDSHLNRYRHEKGTKLRRLREYSGRRNHWYALRTDHYGNEYEICIPFNAVQIDDK